MNLEQIWHLFIRHMEQHEPISAVNKKTIAGWPFLYITCNQPYTKGDLEKLITVSAVYAMKGKQLQSECIFVRNTSSQVFVFRFRFLVPQRKMFCCGNLCADCIRFRDE
jgi:hypothetical protein